MRKLAIFSLFVAYWLASAQQLDPYVVLASAIKQSLTQAQVYIGVGGSIQYGNTAPVAYTMRFYIQGNKAIIDTYVNDERKLLVIADGVKIWRYDPNVKEYTYIKQPEDMAATFGIAAAWSRAEVQRPIRLLAGSVRWLLNPQNETHPDHVRLFEVKPLGQNDWRGTDLNFQLDGDFGKLQSYTIEERIDLPGGILKRLRYDAAFIYNRPFTNVSFSFTPPAGSKPAADLPHRIG